MHEKYIYNYKSNSLSSCYSMIEYINLEVNLNYLSRHNQRFSKFCIICMYNLTIKYISYKEWKFIQYVREIESSLHMYY